MKRPFQGPLVITLDSDSLFHFEWTASITPTQLTSNTIHNPSHVIFVVSSSCNVYIDLAYARLFATVYFGPCGFTWWLQLASIW